MSAELSIAFNDARFGFVDFDELNEVLDAEAGKHSRALVVEVIGKSEANRIICFRNGNLEFCGT